MKIWAMFIKIKGKWLFIGARRTEREARADCQAEYVHQGADAAKIVKYQPIAN